jgi:hypothetical protein
MENGMPLASSAKRGTDMPAQPHWYTHQLNNNILGNEVAGSELTAT